MEIVLALAAVVGISLIAIPRVRRRKRGHVRAKAGKQWGTTSRGPARANGRAQDSRLRSRGRTAAVAAGAGASATYGAADQELDWDDDLDWGGDTAVAAPPPPAPVEDEPVWDDWADEHANGNGN